ncbi:hypothetical protein BH23CHL7_BH23CHL7_22540 [soil metagenome]
MSDRQHDLRATAESIQSDASTVQDLEDQKLALDPDDPRVDLLAERIVTLTDRMSTKAVAERELAEELDDPT